MINSCNVNYYFSKIRKAVLAAALGLFASHTVLAQWDARHTALENAIHDLDLEQARVLLSNEHDPLLREFYASYLDFYLAYCSKEESQSDAYLDQSDKLIDKIREAYKSHPLQHLLVAELFWQRGILKVLDQRNLSAVWELQASFQAIQQQAKAQPQLGVHHKTLASFLIGCSVIPESYRWAANLLGFKADLANGLQHLQKAQGRGQFMVLQAQLAQYFVYKHILIQPQLALHWIDSLALCYPNNPQVIYLKTQCYQEQNRNARALTDLQDFINRHPLSLQRHFPLLQHLLAKCYFLDGQYDHARMQLESFLLQYQGKVLRRDAYAKLALCHAFSGRVAPAKRYFAEALTVENSGFDEDRYATKMANKYIEQPFGEIELDFLRARFAFDAGELQTALRLLHKHKRQLAQLGEEDKTELFYRYGRVYHNQGDANQARQHYLACTVLQPKDKLWMKVQAHYYLGELAEQERQFDMANQYYQQVLRYDNYDFQMGTERKAKAGLERIKEWKRKPR